MSTKLTAKQEAFCLAYLKSSNASEAYRQAYDTKGASPNCVEVNACRLLKNTKVALRIAQLRAPVIARAVYGYEQAMTEAQTAMDLAERLEVPSAMVAAAALRAKLSGLMVEDRKNLRSPLQDIPTDALEQLEQVLGRTHGVVGTTDRQPTNRITH